MTTSPLRMPSGRAISLHEARSLGVSRRQWDKPSRTRLTRTVRRAQPLITLPEMAAGFALAMPGPFAFSHLTALVLHGLPLPEAYVEGPPLHVLRPSGHGRIERHGCVGHGGMERREIVTRCDVPVTGLADTWVDLGELANPALTRDDLTVVGDAALLAFELPLITAPDGTPEFDAQLAELAVADWERARGMTMPSSYDIGVAALAEALARRNRPRGALLLREALGMIRPRVRSPMETRTRLMFVAAGLPEPETGGEVTVAGGWRGEFDLVWREGKVIAEYQGAPHGSLRSRRSDRDKFRLVKDEEWRVFEVYAQDVYNPAARADLIRRIRAALES